MRLVPVQINVNRFEAEKFLRDCLVSISQQTGLGDRFKISIHLCLYGGAEKHHIQRAVAACDAKGIKIRTILSNEKLGYGAKQNLLFHKLTARQKNVDSFITVNPDVILHHECILNLIARFEDNPAKNFIVEARQFPLENPPRGFDKKTGAVDWSSGACILISKDFFVTTQGFDESFFLYCEDVDLSWRAWLLGGRCVYCVDAICVHITRSLFESELVPGALKAQDRYSLLSHLILCWKFFGLSRRRFDAHAGLFWRYTAPPETKLAIWQEFMVVRDKIKALKGRHTRIHVYGVGLYHVPRI
jgi:GT2 family glycosyltransferase